MEDRKRKIKRRKRKKHTHYFPITRGKKKKKYTSPRDKLVILGKHKTSSKEGTPILLPKRKWRHQIS